MLLVVLIAVNKMISWLSVLTRAKRYSFFMPILPCLVAFCQAFPPLYDDVAALLVQVGQVCASDVATKARDIDPSITRKYDGFSRNRSHGRPLLHQHF